MGRLMLLSTLHFQFASCLIFLIFNGAAFVRGDGLSTTPSTSSQSPANPPRDSLIVRQNTTSPFEFPTIQKALDSLQNLTGPQLIYIYGGVYHEQIVIDYRHPLVLQGETGDASSYASNKVLIQHDLAAKDAGSNAASATLNVVKNDFFMYNINVTNNYGTGTDTQALALTAKGSQQGYYGCTFSSFQDTVRVFRGTQFFGECYIEGAVDFIFTRDAMVWFEHLTIGVKASQSKETITASGRNSKDSLGYLVFNRAKIISLGAAPGSGYLGRPWGKFARALFQNSYMSDVINPDGWIGWNPPDDLRTDNVTFQEFDNTGPGAVGPRKYTQFLNASYVISDILSPNYTHWVDSRFLS